MLSFKKRVPPESMACSRECVCEGRAGLGEGRVAEGKGGPEGGTPRRPAPNACAAKAIRLSGVEFSTPPSPPLSSYFHRIDPVIEPGQPSFISAQGPRAASHLERSRTRILPASLRPCKSFWWRRQTAVCPQQNCRIYYPSIQRKITVNIKPKIARTAQ